jgi:O-acetyl-ADP-ribose deacetylase (regulator of RNase III)
MEWIAPNGRKLMLLEGDITRVAVDAIVNAANSSLAGGGGVDGAIPRAGGPSIMAELDGIRKSIGRCPAGDAVATTAGRLPAKEVFHAVGPIYRDGSHGEPEALASCYRTCLRLAAEHGDATISFPSISTGAYSYPLQDAARIAVGEVTGWLAATGSSVREVTFVLFDRRTFQAYAAALP